MGDSWKNLCMHFHFYWENILIESGLDVIDYDAKGWAKEWLWSSVCREGRVKVRICAGCERRGRYRRRAGTLQSRKLWSSSCTCDLGWQPWRRSAPVAPRTRCERCSLSPNPPSSPSDWPDEFQNSVVAVAWLLLEYVSQGAKLQRRFDRRARVVTLNQNLTLKTSNSDE